MNTPAVDARPHPQAPAPSPGQAPMQLQVRVRYFAALREALGSGETVVLPAGSTLAALRDHLIASSARHADALARSRTVRCALNQTMADETALLADGAEVAFFPPVTGG